MATYREAWGLFQDEPKFPSNNTSMTQTTPDPSASTTTISKTEFVSELRRLRQDLQELQSASSHPHQNPQISDRPEPLTSTAQPDNPLDPASDKSETFRSGAKGGIREAAVFLL
ncbi:uncharacterized protein CDV56_108324 [Aspergillus thermomutatus]|uniref:Uncharacterized protein n=1 Tax=Aspergillus thermomutatus TaxID=41047 RepID=A0A397HR35_ASPTH|nr:uncharacterized protein CDV56_108324 [Aspergillus thermomutatus]RHZ63613.1 hypothetical protein CDV56_108324 [Aspergillus thermomutatus]